MEGRSPRGRHPCKKLGSGETKLAYEDPSDGMNIDERGHEVGSQVLYWLMRRNQPRRVAWRRDSLSHARGGIAAWVKIGIFRYVGERTAPTFAHIYLDFACLKSPTLHIHFE